MTQQQHATKLQTATQQHIGAVVDTQTRRSYVRLRAYFPYVLQQY